MVAAEDPLGVQVEELYSVFRDYPARAVMPANCTCCDPFTDEVLASKPLKALSSADLMDYFYLAVEDVGDENEFRHFLPRNAGGGVDGQESLDGHGNDAR
jgi:hypothetical protein